MLARQDRLEKLADSRNMQARRTDWSQPRSNTQRLG